MPRRSPTEHRTDAVYVVRYRGEWMGTYVRGEFGKAEDHFRRLGGAEAGADVECRTSIPCGNVRDGYVRTETRIVRGVGA